MTFCARKSAAVAFGDEGMRLRQRGLKKQMIRMKLLKREGGVELKI